MTDTASALGGVIEKLERGEKLSPEAIKEIDRLLALLRGEGWSGFITADSAVEAILRRGSRVGRAAGGRAVTESLHEFGHRLHVKHSRGQRRTTFYGTCSCGEWASKSRTSTTTVERDHREHVASVTEGVEEREARLRAAALDVRLRDAQTVGDLLEDAREALEAAYAELGRAEEHHRWHHEQEGREVEQDDERLRVLMVIAEALDSLGADDE